MKKNLLLVVSLVLAACLLSSCAYMPIMGLNAMYSMRSEGAPTEQNGVFQTAAPADSDMVTIPRAQYEQYRKFDKLIEMMEIAEDNFYLPVDEAKLLEAAAAGLLSGLDDHYSFYYSPEAYAELWEDDEGEYCGIGVQITSYYSTGICTITRVFEGGPAQQAGVRKGDILYKVEDIYVNADTLQEAVDIMRGVPGTDVSVIFLRNGEEIPLTMTRAVVNTTRVEWTMLDEEVGLIVLYEFAGDCAERFKAGVDDLIAKGAKGIIIDLRDNPGGWVNDAQDIADIFLDSGLLCYLEYKDGSKYYYRTKNGKVDNMQLVVLVNENSASSSEILTGCLKDRADATVVGVQSYGKGIVQVIVPVSTDGSGMQVTVAQYYTPNGNAVHKIGITPDVIVELDEGDVGMHELGDLSDAQLARALEVMHKKLEEAAK